MAQGFDRMRPEELSSDESSNTSSAGEPSAEPVAEGSSLPSEGLPSDPKTDDASDLSSTADPVDPGSEELQTDTGPADQEELPEDRLTSKAPAEEGTASLETPEASETLETSEDSTVLDDSESPKEKLPEEQSDLSSDLDSGDSIPKDRSEETLPEDGDFPLVLAGEESDGDMYALVLEGFQVTGELMMIQIGLMALLFAMFVFRFVYRLISNMVTKFD